MHFNLINPKTNNRIRMQTVDAGTGRAVDRSDLVKGYAVSKEQVRAVREGRARRGAAESTRVIDIGEFVDATVDRPHLLGRTVLPWRPAARPASRPTP